MIRPGTAHRLASDLGPTLLLLVLAIAAPGPALALKLDVKVEGVQGEQQTNVLALLGIYQERKDENLSVARLLALHRRAPDQIHEALAPFGLYRVEVEDSLTEPPNASGSWVASYRISPGEPVKVAVVNYQITGPGASNPRFPKRFPLRVGDVLLHARYENARDELSIIASEEGYLDADLVRHQVLIDPIAYEAIVDIHLETGPRYYLGRVEFKQDLLADAYLQRFVTFKPGSVYDPDELLDLQGRLLGMEYFDKVEIVPQTDQADPNNVVPVEVIAHPNKANKYRIGLGFGTDVGPRLLLEYRRRYIGAYGHKLKTEIQVSQPLQSFVAEYRIPARNPVQDYFLIRPEIYIYDTTSRQGDIYKLSGAYSVRTKGGWRRNIGIDYRYENYTVADTGDESFNGLVPNISWSKVVADDPINTRNGYRIKYLLQGTTVGLAETSWLTGSLSVKWIKSFLSDNYRFITRADLGATWAATLDDVPGSLRFFAGGDSSIRGWGLDALGPNDPVTDQTVGGRFLAVGSLELERRIKGNWSAAAFTDFGNAFDPEYTLEWEQSVGLGVHYQTPIGQIRFDVAYALTKDPPGARLSLVLGPDL